MSQLVIKAIELKGFKAELIKTKNLYRVIVKDKTSASLVDNCYLEFTQANFTFDTLVECFERKRK